jgi:5-hydroxyisourate hydrolase-like protein (transthyretin family)
MPLIIVLAFLVQNPANLPPAGIVTGVVRSTAGTPAAGVRVYAMAVRDSKDAADSPTVLESISETDASGRYRLEIAPGRYYIAAGSIDAPTYHPGTTNVSTAQVFSVTSGSTTEGVDFSRFNPAVRLPDGLLGLVQLGLVGPAGTGVLSGVIRLSDGSPAVGVSVAALRGVNVMNATLIFARGVPAPANCVAPTSSRVTAMGFSATRTDATGRYRLANISPGSYQIVAGFADSPVFHPGVTDAARATSITTTQTTNLDTLDFTMPAIPPGTTLGGQISAVAGAPVSGATVLLHSLNAATPLAIPVLPARSSKEVRVRPDGSFEIGGVPPGAYCVEARLSGTSPIYKDIVVADRPVRDLQFSFPVSVLSGRLLWEDGSPFSDTQALGDAMVTTVANPNFVATTMISIDNTGSFSTVLESGEYRFYLRLLPDGYTIKSMTSGSTDLLKETLKIGQATLPNVEIRMARRNAVAEPNVRGRVLDNISGKPAAAERVELCCLQSGPFERFSTPLRPDGSFEFRDIPPGRYTPELRARPILLVVNPDIEVGSEGVSGLTIGSMSTSVWLSTRIVVEGGNVPPNMRLSVTLTGTASVVPVTGVTMSDALALLVPVGDQYTVSVSNLPPGYVVKSIRNGSIDLLNGGRLNVTTQPLPESTITLARSP